MSGKLEQITTEFAEYICDNLCRHLHNAQREGMEIEGVCAECRMGQFVIDICNSEKDNWILCPERLPEPRNKVFGSQQQRVEVIACQRNGVVKEMLFEFATKEFWEAGDTNSISHWKEDVNDPEYEIVAWQPLPDSYEVSK